METILCVFQIVGHKLVDCSELGEYRFNFNVLITQWNKILELSNTKAQLCYVFMYILFHDMGHCVTNQSELLDIMLDL